MWNIEIDRASDVVLDPLTDVGFRMFVTIGICRGQLVVDVLGHGEWSETQDDANYPQCDS